MTVRAGTASGLWTPPEPTPATEYDFFDDIDGLLSVLSNVHRPTDCIGEWCVIHKPSDHHMIDWSVAWSRDAKLVLRVCNHAIVHPDPDAWAALLMMEARNGYGITDAHGCDGCCDPEVAAKELSPLAQLMLRRPTMTQEEYDMELEKLL